MMIEDDRSFYRRRIEQERSAADSATCEIVRDTHLELLELYTAQLSLLSSANLWQAPAPNDRRRSLSAFFASPVERPAHVAETALRSDAYHLHRRPH
jgi:hypothetical protein